MTSRTFLMLVMALVLAGGAAFVANNWLNSQSSGNQRSQENMVAVVAAAVDIGYGKKLEMAQLKMVSMPAASIPAGSYSNPEDVDGMVALQSIVSGEIILEAKVTEHLGGSTLAAVITPGKRAMSVRVNDVVGVSGFLLPGNRVDVLSAKSGGRGGSSITTILQDMKVLAVDQTTSTERNEPVVVRAVTLEVDPSEAEILVKATREGTVQLSLRNPVDNQQVAMISEEKAAPREAPRPVSKRQVRPSVEILRGTRTESMNVRR